MTDPNTPSGIAAGWYPETAGSSRLRWWDGQAWTEHTADPTPPAPAQSEVAPSVPVTVAPAAPGQTPVPQAESFAAPGFGAPYSGVATTASPGTKTGTVFIWLIVLLPLLGLIPLSLINLSGVFSNSISDPGNASASLALYTDPAYDASLALSFLTYLVTALLAWRDSRTLRARGIVQPFPWPFIFIPVLNSGTYVIGRSVVVRRRTGGGLAPLWGWIAVFVVNIVAGIVIVIAALGPLLSQMGTNA